MSTMVFIVFIIWDIGYTILKNVVFSLSLQAGARPSLEPSNLLPTDPLVRPADVLVMGTPQILNRLGVVFPDWLLI